MINRKYFAKFCPKHRGKQLLVFCTTKLNMKGQGYWSLSYDHCLGSAKLNNDKVNCMIRLLLSGVVALG